MSDKVIGRSALKEQIAQSRAEPVLVYIGRTAKKGSVLYWIAQERNLYGILGNCKLSFPERKQQARENSGTIPNSKTVP